MLEQLRCLIAYQKLEDKRTNLIRSYEETPKRIGEMEKEFAVFEEECLSKKTEYDNLKKMHHTLEQEIADLEERVTRNKSRTSEVKTNKEYQAMLKEIDETKKEIARKEESSLTAMEGIERLAKELEELQTVLTKQKKKVDEVRRKLEVENKQLKGRLDKVDALKQKVRDKIPPEVMKRTDFLFQRQAGIAVASVENGVCQVCHLNIPPQKFIELQRDESLQHCPHCHRFIYWPGHEGYCIIEEDQEEI